MTPDESPLMYLFCGGRLRPLSSSTTCNCACFGEPWQHAIALVIFGKSLDRKIIFHVVFLSLLRNKSCHFTWGALAAKFQISPKNPSQQKLLEKDRAREAMWKKIEKVLSTNIILIFDVKKLLQKLLLTEKNSRTNLTKR